MQTANRSGPPAHEGPTAHEKAFLIGYAIARARPEYVGQVLRGVLRASNEINEINEAEADNQQRNQHNPSGDCAVNPPFDISHIECVPSGRGGYDHE